jgi:hypothetical protein
VRIPVDPEFKKQAEEQGLPMFRVQIDWRFVPKEKRAMKSHESCGYLSLEKASELFRWSLSDFAERAEAEQR